jgi:Zn-dependent protease with chaperone function
MSKSDSDSTAIVHVPQDQPIQLSSLKVHLHLSPEAFQHPDDRKATETLQSVPVFPQIVNLIAGNETAMRLHLLSQCIRVGPNQAVDLFRHYVRASQVLSLPDLPELFIRPDDSVNAFAMGIKRPTIVVTRGLLEAMSMSEVMAVMAHELGHVKCHHMTNKTIASMIAMFGVMGVAQMIPVLGKAALYAIQVPLSHWSRMAELSCDRASLLAVRDPKIVAGMLAKIGGWPKTLGQVDFQSLRGQTEEYDRLDNDAVASILKIISMLDSLYLTHPLPINRIHRILQWSTSEQYQQILAGGYVHLDQKPPQLRCSECCEVAGTSDRVCSNCGKKIKVDPMMHPACFQCGTAISEPPPNFCPKCGVNLGQSRSATA